MQDLSSQPGIEPTPLAVKALSPNLWTTRESLLKAFFSKYSLVCVEANLGLDQKIYYICHNIYAEVESYYFLN